MSDKHAGGTALAAMAAIVAAVAWLAAAPIAQAAGPQGFALHSGDRVCFYGDSITEQRFYPAEVETYTLTRFPGLRVRFVDAGVGGDTVQGGWAGPIDLRLRRDVFPFHPNIVTIMLGMNDARYRPFDPKIFATFQQGYEHIIASLQQHLPGVQIVLLATSPFDDVTQPPQFPGGYNGVLDRYGQFVRQLARRHHLLFVDFNAPMVRVMRAAERINPKLAKQIIPGRVHPSAAGQMMMAEALLRAWGAPATVTRVRLDAQGAVRQAVNARITGLSAAGGGLQWTERDGSLPMPVLGLHAQWPQFPAWDMYRPPQPQPGVSEPAAALINKLGGFTRYLDQEPLQVTGLAAGQYRLAIDGQAVATFSARGLAAGVNLAGYMTPMMRQAYRVDNLVWEQIAAHFVPWRYVQTSLQNFSASWPGAKGQELPVNAYNNPAAARAVTGTLRAMHGLLRAIVAQEHRANQPRPHRFTLTPVR
ncbi:MAG: SGNH/GDSL hydrolase family protein [Terriglobales bacterium]